MVLQGHRLAAEVKRPLYPDGRNELRQRFRGNFISGITFRLNSGACKDDKQTEQQILSHNASFLPNIILNLYEIKVSTVPLYC